MKQMTLTLIAATAFAFAQSQAQESLLADLNDLAPRSLEVEAFTLDQDQKIQIDAVGAGSSRREAFFASAWILNAETREVVWELNYANTKRRERALREFNGEISLPRGTYEVYYSFFAYNWGRHGSFGNAIAYVVDEFFSGRGKYDTWYDDEGRKYDPEEFRELGIIIKGRGTRLTQEEIRGLRENFQEDAIVTMAALWDDDYRRQGFELKQPMALEIYALGEARTDGDFDHGWIIDTRTREKVWRFDYDHSEHAGGAEKNRMSRETIPLPAGKYAVFFATDDSHSHRRWNSPPPYDPEFWGITIRAKDAAMRQYAATFDYEDLPPQNVVVELTRARDDDYLSKGFTLKQPMEIRVYALGEGREGEMFDYGWIVDAKTRKKIWTMDFYDTEHAGGAEKNRLFDGTLRLEKGSYLAYFVTDGSHSFRDWNTSPPYDPERWGLTLMASSADFNPNDVASYEPQQDGAILAQLTNVRDHQHRQANFSLTKNAEVRLYAIGEGRDGEMFDYGWIEDARTGRVVWEMTYRMTEHAGGAHKNRVFDDTISLKSGEYVLHYKTDGSHSWRDWNASQPHDPEYWGITMYRVEK